MLTVGVGAVGRAHAALLLNSQISAQHAAEEAAEEQAERSPSHGYRSEGPVVSGLNQPCPLCPTSPLAPRHGGALSADTPTR
jgi:hypothetical protein